MNNIKGLSNKKRAEIARLAERIYEVGFTDGQTASSSVEDTAVKTIKLESLDDLKLGDKVKYVGRRCDFNNDVTNGNIYVIERIDSDGDRIISDDKNKSFISNIYLHLFEKVIEGALSESNTIEHEGKLLRKVDCKAFGGDYIRLTKRQENSTVAVTADKFYEVFNERDVAKFITDDGCQYSVYNENSRRTPENVEVFEVVEGFNPQIPMYDETIELTSVPLTANQQRAEVNQRAREFVELNTTRNHFDREDKPSIWLVNDGYYGKSHIVEFVVDPTKRTVVALIKVGSAVRYRGIAKCMPGDVFNEWIGKAIALAKALQIDIPQEFLDAVQPDKVVAGMVIERLNNWKEVYRDSVINSDGHLHSINRLLKHPEEVLAIIDDTNAVYGKGE